MSRVLVVDDEARIRRIVSVLLEHEGFQVETAESGEQALEEARSFGPDVVLLDLSMPGMDGLETLEHLRQEDGDLQAIMMTAYGTVDTAVEALRGGAFHYLTKPFDNDQIVQTVRQAVERRRLTSEVRALTWELEQRYGFSDIIGISPPMQQLFKLMSKVAPTEATVLVRGESGTGKELVARSLHRHSQRSDGPFVGVNCSAVPDNLIESEFFGHEKGAFTDARRSRKGSFEQADGGTLFLDEVGDLSLAAQAKLLRALQERRIRLVGAEASRPVDVRVVAATNKDLERAAREGEFREDLYWRLNVVHLELPPLRDRPEDLPLLVDHMLDSFGERMGMEVTRVSPQARALLETYDWPGNVRELENVLQRAVIVAEGDEVTERDLPPRLGGGGADPEDADELGEMGLKEAVEHLTERLERRMIRDRLDHFDGNRTATAESLKVSRKTLFNKIQRYGLDTAGETDEASEVTAGAGEAS